MTTATTASKEAPAKEPLFNVCELYTGPDFAWLVDRLDLAYPDVSPQTLVEGLVAIQGDPDAVETAIADIREASEALSWVACKAETLLDASNALASDLEELGEYSYFTAEGFGELIKSASQFLSVNPPKAFRYKEDQAIEEVASWFDLKGTGLFQEGK